MKYQSGLFIISVAVFSAYCAHAAQNAPTAFSQYGLIQPVNKYSSNPFWNPDSPYNQRMPIPVYATGADLNTGDCNRIVENLVISYCSSHNNCSDSRLTDVRPTVMVQLSQLPGHNFATSCGGYIDNIFENYQKTYGNMSAGTVRYTTTPTTTSTNYTQYENPFKVTPTEYQSGVAERTAELENLQHITTASPELSPTYFPKTSADLSFTDRLANTTAGYEPYKNLNSYKTPRFESDNEYYERLKKLNPTEYCKKFPNDTGTCVKQIKYELFGGTNDPKNPTSYIFGSGATISGNPTRKDSIFLAWCSDSDLSQCTKTQTISKNANTDFTFYAKWDCTNGKVLQNNMCIDPAATGSSSGSFGIGSNPGQDTEQVTPNEKAYTLLQCRVKPGRLQDPIYLNKNKPMTNPAEALECAGTPTVIGFVGRKNIKDIDKCFTPCGKWTTAEKGIINTKIEDIVGHAFCSGNQYLSDPNEIWGNDGTINTNHIWFLSETSDNGGLQMIKLTNVQVDAIKKALENAQSETESVCTSDKRHWIIYVLERTDDKKWLAVDSITIGGKNP